jgi:hypothetical protein
MHAYDECPGARQQALNLLDQLLEPGAIPV